LSLETLRASLADRYTVEGELGEGGMATVYLATDVKHRRRVAVKVLKPELAAAVGAERFLREIETTANLRHPHILPLYDSGEAGGILFYVMPFVEGETLRDRLLRERQLPLEDALRIAREVADALAYAHSRGVIHRDIKPANILLDSGHALVADFGIALAVEGIGTERMTRTGMSIGTPQYMSPEQASADRAIDARSDIYALGAVTYEMLTGEPPFQGATAQAVFAKALTERPTAPSVIRETVSPELDAAVAKALARLPADRFATAAAFASAISSAEHAGGGGMARQTLSRVRRPLVPMLVAAALIVAAYLVGTLSRPAAANPLGRFGQATQVTWESGLEITPAISPDGKLVAYAAGNGSQFRIYVRPVAGGRDVPLTDDSTGAETAPEWSRDGSRILFLDNGRVFSAPSGGGAARQEVPSRGADVESAAWSPDERKIVYVVADSIFVQDAAGTSRRIGIAQVPSMCTWSAQHLIACLAGNWAYLKPGMAFGNLAPSWIIVIDPATGRITGVTDSLSSNVAPRWTPDGKTLLYVSNRLGPPDIYALGINRHGTATGDPVRLTVGMNVNSFSLSADGSRMAFSVMHTGSNIYSQPWHHGAPVAGDRPTEVTFGQQVIEGFSISRDTRWLYYDSDASGNPDIYRMRLPSGEPERLTTARSPEFNPAPSPDGREVAFHSWRTGSRDIFIMPLDGGPLVQVTHTPDQEQYVSWSPDGRRLAFASQSAPFGVFVSHLDNGQWHTRKLVAVGHWSAWSPDGRYLSYVTVLYGGGLRVIPADSGTPRAVYDETAPGAPQAETSQWSADGKTIYFRSHAPDGEGEIWEVPSAGGTPHRLLRLGDGRLRSDRYGFRIAGDRLYYTLFDRQSNVWVIDLHR
jgi:eukaryotic-like serine/threonine-protein kinase